MTTGRINQVSTIKLKKKGKLNKLISSGSRSQGEIPSEKDSNNPLSFSFKKGFFLIQVSEHSTANLSIKTVKHPSPSFLCFQPLRPPS